MPTSVSEVVKMMAGFIAAPILDAAFWVYDKWDQWSIERERQRDLS